MQEGAVLTRGTGSAPTCSQSPGGDDLQVGADSDQADSFTSCTTGPGGALQSNAKCHPSMPVPLDRDPCLPREGRPLQYIDVFVDDFLGLNQGRARGRRTRRILLHAIDSIIRPLSPNDNPHRREPVLLKSCGRATARGARSR